MKLNMSPTICVEFTICLLVPSADSLCKQFDRVATQYPFQNSQTFTDFSLTFNCFPDPFGRQILAIFIHRLFKDFAQIFELADLIFKEKS